MSVNGDMPYWDESVTLMKKVRMTEGQYLRGGASYPSAVDTGNVLSTEITDSADLGVAHIVKGLLIANKGTVLTLTIKAQTDVTYLANSVIVVENIGAGTLTVTAAAGVSLNGTATGSFTLAQYANCYLRRNAEDAWIAPNQTVA
jgi:hypothetical protein